MFITSKNELPLSHLTIIDLADETGAFCSRILNMAGAQVIRIEPPPAYNITGTEHVGGNYSPVTNPEYVFNNSGKFSITLNLNKTKGRDIFEKLSGSADILIKTHTPQYCGKKKLDYEYLSQINNRLIMVSITGFGTSGPSSKYPQTDSVISASSGLTFVNGEKDGRPIKLYGKQSHYLPSLFAAMGILIAIQERCISNRGQYIDISMQEAMTSALGMIMSRYFQYDTIVSRNGATHWAESSAIFPCADGFIFITFEREWDTLVDWMASENMASEFENKAWQDMEYRRQNMPQVIQIISEWTKTHRVNELFETAQLMRFPWAPVETIERIMDNPQLNTRNYFSGFEDMQASLSGEHNHLIYSDKLGFSGKQINQLKKDGII